MVSFFFVSLTIVTRDDSRSLPTLFCGPSTAGVAIGDVVVHVGPAPNRLLPVRFGQHGYVVLFYRVSLWWPLPFSDRHVLASALGSRSFSFSKCEFCRFLSDASRFLPQVSLPVASPTVTGYPPPYPRWGGFCFQLNIRCCCEGLSRLRKSLGSSTASVTQPSEFRRSNGNAGPHNIRRHFPIGLERTTKRTVGRTSRWLFVAGV